MLKNSKPRLSKNIKTNKSKNIRKIAKAKGGKKSFNKKDVEQAIVFVSITSVGKEFGISNQLVDNSKFVSEVSSSSSEDEADSQPACRDLRTVFDVDLVEDPLVGSPTDVREDLDALALRLQKHPRDQVAFLRIVCYMHKYILGLVFKKYPFVRGQDEKDIYQEALIAIFRKAVPSFRLNKGMSFLNFAKMCINRHLITILNASRNRRKDMPLNTSVSLDHAPAGHEDDENCTLSSIIPDTVHGKPPFTEMARSESFDRTFTAINAVLSDFERAVLMEYLKDKSYREASRAVSKVQGKRCNERSIDNALLRIRKKALMLKKEMGDDDLPLVFGAG